MATLTDRTTAAESWRLAEVAIQTAPSVCIAGLPGTGKSLAALTPVHPAGTVLPEDIYTLTLHDDAIVGDVIGNYLPRAGKWDWRDGPALLAWAVSLERPSRLVCNEIDQAAGAVLTALYAIMDSPESARLTLPTGETRRPHALNFQVVSTMNGAVSDLPAALADRHVAQVTCNHPHPGSIAALPSEWQATAEGMCNPSARLEGRGTTPRDWHGLATLTRRGLSLSDAAALIWSPERAAEVADHLSIVSAPTAPRLAPDPVVAPAPAGQSAGTPSGWRYLCPVGHGTNGGVAPDGSTYPDASGEIFCGEGDCCEFYPASEGEARAAGIMPLVSA